MPLTGGTMLAPALFNKKGEIKMPLIIGLVLIPIIIFIIIKSNSITTKKRDKIILNILLILISILYIIKF